MPPFEQEAKDCVWATAIMDVLLVVHVRHWVAAREFLPVKVMAPLWPTTTTHWY
jgi:hypothetical protein